jgi:hypothetical protein
MAVKLRKEVKNNAAQVGLNKQTAMVRRWAKDATEKEKMPNRCEMQYHTCMHYVPVFVGAEVGSPQHEPCPVV